MLIVFVSISTFAKRLFQFQALEQKKFYFCLFGFCVLIFVYMRTYRVLFYSGRFRGLLSIPIFVNISCMDVFIYYLNPCFLLFVLSITTDGGDGRLPIDGLLRIFIGVELLSLVHCLRQLNPLFVFDVFINFLLEGVKGLLVL